MMVEPGLDESGRQIWLTDKVRQYFVSSKKKLPEDTKTSQLFFFENLIETLYAFNLPVPHKYKNSFFTVVFENLSIEMLAVMGFLHQKYSFIKPKRFENTQYCDGSAEHKNQLNSTTEENLNISTLCLLISTNPRYEGYYLNLNLRQRFMKGNFKCFILGSLIDLTFSVKAFLGSNISIIKLIGNGNHFLCRDLAKEVNPIIIYNDELLKRKDGNHVVEAMKNIHSLTNLNRAWGNLNMLNSSISSAGTKLFQFFSPVTSKDLVCFSSLYFLNVTMNNLFNLKKIAELKLLNYDLKPFKVFKEAPVLIDQNTAFKNSSETLRYTKNFKEYYFPNPSFHENDDTYINSEGSVKKAFKLMPVKETSHSWQVLKDMLKNFTSNILFLNSKDNFTVFFNTAKKLAFKNFISVQYYAVASLFSLSFHLTTKNSPVMFSDVYSFFKLKTLKVCYTKATYWLDDFYVGGNDLYSQNSTVLVDSAELLRYEQTNFYV